MIITASTGLASSHSSPLHSICSCFHAPDRIHRRRIRRASFLVAVLVAWTAICGAGFARAQGLTLQDAIATSLLVNERALAASERIDAANARVWRARSAFFPNLSLTGNYQRRPFEVVRSLSGSSESIVIQRIDALSASANASLTLFDARLFPLFSQARSDRDANVSDAENAKRQLAYDVANAFLQALSSTQVARAADQRQSFAQSNLDAARARYDAQLVGINDVTRAELELATAERERTVARGASQTAELQLEFLLNAPLDRQLDPPVELERAAEQMNFDPEQLARIAEERRLDLAAFRARANALHATATEALLRVTPALTASAQYRATNEAGFSGQSTTWSVGAVLSWTLFDGGAWMADRSERLSLARAADYQAEETERRIHVDIRSALVVLANARAARNQSAVALDAARKNATESNALYKQGLATALAAADANVRLFEAEVAHAGAYYNLMAAFLATRHITGLDPLEDSLPTESK